MADKSPIPHILTLTDYAINITSSCDCLLLSTPWLAKVPWVFSSGVQSEHVETFASVVILLTRLYRSSGQTACFNGGIAYDTFTRSKRTPLHIRTPRESVLLGFHGFYLPRSLQSYIRYALLLKFAISLDFCHLLSESFPYILWNQHFLLVQSLE